MRRLVELGARWIERWDSAGLFLFVGLVASIAMGTFVTAFLLAGALTEVFR